jgi:hypothetical protein
MYVQTKWASRTTLEAIFRREVYMVQSYAGRGLSRVAISRRQHYLLPHNLLLSSSSSSSRLLHSDDTHLDLFTAISVTLLIIFASPKAPIRVCHLFSRWSLHHQRC